MPREPINIECVQTAARRKEVRAFAASYDHVVHDHFALYGVKRGQKLIGYCQFLNQPICIPSWHTDPAICSPRDITESASILRGWQQGNNTQGDVIIALGINGMSPETIVKLGFRPWMDLYVSTQK